MQYLGSNSSYEKSIDSVGREADPIDPEVSILLGLSLSASTCAKRNLRETYLVTTSLGRQRENLTFRIISVSGKKTLTACQSHFQTKICNLQLCLLQHSCAGRHLLKFT
jgi:hypothetical protein